MAQIPATSISPRLIYDEINGTTTDAGAAINAPTGVTMESLRTSSIAYVGGDGDSPNVQTTPNRFNEWADYQHTQTFSNTVTYYVRTDSSPFNTNNGVTNRAAQLVSDSTNCGMTSTHIAQVFYFILNGSTIEWYMDPDDHWGYSPGDTDYKSGAAYGYNTSGGALNFSGSYTAMGGSGYSPRKIAQFTPDSTSGLQVRMTATHFSGYGTWMQATSGYTLGDGSSFATTGWQTPSSTKYGVGPKALSGLAEGFTTMNNQVGTYFVTEVKATGYNTKTLNTFVNYIFANATDTCGF